MSSQKNGISWTDETWNPIVGCSKVSSGCKNCWAERQARLHYHKDFPNGWWSGAVLLHEDRLEQPLHWKKSKRIAVGLMGDLFHESVPDDFIEKVFYVMAISNHTFQILTKRPKRMLDWMRGEWRDVMIEGGAQKLWHDRTGVDPSLWLAVHLPLPNVWLGVSVEDQKTWDERVPYLSETPAALRFVSGEPLLGEIYSRDLRTQKIDWVICGGESGLGARPMHPDWVRSLRDQCIAAGVPFHFKQRGEWTWSGQGESTHIIFENGEYFPKDQAIQHKPGRTEPYAICRVGKKAAGHFLDGQEWLQFPEARIAVE